MKVLILYMFLAGIVSWLLTGLIRRYAFKKNILDIPNFRSSHVAPIPRGGGIAIVLPFLGGLLLMYITNLVDISLTLALFGSGLIVAIVGFIDDHRHVSPKWRLLVHFFAAFWAVIWLSNPQSGNFIELLGYKTWLLYIILVFILVWMLNLYNFMDGIDGIAASEAIFVAGCGLLFAALGGYDSQQLVAVLLIGATLGFLFWNRPPAKIFMGDVGSGFLGITIGIYAFWTARDDIITYWSWAIIIGVFLVDATFTLFRRILRKARWYEAHRSHAYQHAAQRWGHLPVTLSVTFINIFWLLPIAYFANVYRDRAPELALLALTPIIVLVFLLGAGKDVRE